MKRKDIVNIPKIGKEPRGTNNKYWIKDKGINKLVKYNSDIYPDLDVMESLASDILKKIKIDCVNVELGYNSDIKQNCCIIDSFLLKDCEVLYEIDIDWPEREIKDINREIEMSFGRVFGIFYKLCSEEELKQLIKQYIRKTLGDIIIGNEDGKLKNTGLIFNEETHRYRLTPNFDNGLAFHSYIFGQSNEPICYIGNQGFTSNEVLTYILNNKYDDVSDIIDSFNDFMENDYIQLIDTYQPVLEPKKYHYIIKHLDWIKYNIDTLLPKNHKAR